MARGKQSMPESTDITEVNALESDAEQKARNVSAKVTLVKPMQQDSIELSSEENAVVTADTPENETPAKQATRPKVGRSGTARKKKSEGAPKAEKTEKTEKKAGRKGKAELVEQEVLPPHSDEPAPTPVKSERKKKTELVMAVTQPVELPVQEGPVLEKPVAPEPVHVEKIQEALEQVELTPDWEPEHSRPWSFRSILVGVILFAAINLGFMALFSVNHKTATTPSGSAAHFEPATPAQLDEPVHDAAKPAAPVAAQPAPQQPAAVVPAFPVQPQAKSQPQAPVAAATQPAPMLHGTPAQSAAVTAVTVSTLPPPPAQLPSANAPAKPAEVAAAPAAQAPVATQPQAAANPAEAQAAAEREKASNQQELFSILNKD